jgi:hypothetical protein
LLRSAIIPPDGNRPLLYTLSTIAQTLAGALAILVTVVVFRLAMLRTLIEAAKDSLRSYSVDPSIYWPSVRDFGYEAMADQAQKDGGYILHHSRDLRRACDAAVKAYHEWGRINPRLYAALGFTVADIALCFIALPLTPRITCSQSATRAILLAAIGLGITCLGLYVRLIAAMVRRPAD